jgi:hypothetical protein
MPIGAAAARAAIGASVFWFIVGAGTVLSVIGTHLYAIRPKNYLRMRAR